MKRYYAIMFADIADSTRLYQELGDRRAEQRISRCLQQVSEIARDYNGWTIKTIGDEVMCCFLSCTAAVKAAIETQLQTGEDTQVPALTLRIGLHSGDVIERDNDVFGDAVNTAAQMTAIAKAGQIITTESFVSQLGGDLTASAQLFDTTKVKGKPLELKVYQINWEDSGDTTFISGDGNQRAFDSTLALEFCFGDERRRIAEKDIKSPLSIGRDRCDITIDAECASRSHADLDFRRGKFVLIDHSTNGTYVRFNGQPDVFIRREALPLIGDGVISLGQAVSDDSAALISFSIVDNTR